MAPTRSRQALFPVYVDPAPSLSLSSCNIPSIEHSSVRTSPQKRKASSKSVPSFKEKPVDLVVVAGNGLKKRDGMSDLGKVGKNGERVVRREVLRDVSQEWGVVGCEPEGFKNASVIKKPFDPVKPGKLRIFADSASLPSSRPSASINTNDTVTATNAQPSRKPFSVYTSPSRTTSAITRPKGLGLGGPGAARGLRS
ncbi:hypothetical protein [Phaffia rhodozyma]|uniref:Uncharacterized protein n=1 Tax=Phaffia rhodozyma TaxID=264483 RepID=A0A0F7SP93_PHARH|nr:hypothetical protein [Phaffia rhodozyma]